jgi:hypothetical protein
LIKLVGLSFNPTVKSSKSTPRCAMCSSVSLPAWGSNPIQWPVVATANPAARYPTSGGKLISRASSPSKKAKPIQTASIKVQEAPWLDGVVGLFKVSAQFRWLFRQSHFLTTVLKSGSHQLALVTEFGAAALLAAGAGKACHDLYKFSDGCLFDGLAGVAFTERDRLLPTQSILFAAHGATGFIGMQCQLIRVGLQAGASGKSDSQRDQNGMEP